jgi:hypothetical protein
VNAAAFGRPNPRATALALLTAVVLVAGCGCSARLGRSPSSPGAAGVGHKWRLTQVAADGKTAPIPESITATVQFTADGQFLADDSVNALSGTWMSTPTGYRVRSSGSTFVVYAGQDSTKLEAISAIDSVTLALVDVAAEGTGNALTLAGPKYTLTFIQSRTRSNLPAAITHNGHDPTPIGRCWPERVVYLAGDRAAVMVTQEPGHRRDFASTSPPVCRYRGQVRR